MARKIINTLLSIVNVLLLAFILWAFRDVINDNAPFFTVIVAAVAFLFMGRQTKIMKQQTALTEKIDESNKIGTMLARYADLRDIRQRFWDIAPRIYNDLRTPVKDLTSVELPESLEKAIDNAGFPPGFNPDEVTNLFYYVKNLEPMWSDIALWQFMIFLYPKDEDVKKSDLINSRPIDYVYDCRSQLAYFWNDWSYQLEDIGRHVQANPRELVILTWFELALIRQVGDTAARAGKVNLFRFAKTQWNLFVKELRHA